MGALDAANWEKYYGNGNNYPDDLNKNNQVKTGQNYFTIPIEIEMSMLNQFLN